MAQKGQVDFAHGSIKKNVMQTALPMLAAQMLHLLYNIVDRIYIGRIPEVGTMALGGIGLCFPIVMLVLAFTNLFGSGGAPLCAIERGKGDEERAAAVMNTAFRMLLITAICITVIGQILARPMLFAFGASEATIAFALPYLRIYLLGTLASMLATGLNPYINAQGFARIGMMTVFIGAFANIILDPLFIFTLGMGVRGAALATVLSQILSAVFAVRFLSGKNVPLRLSLGIGQKTDWQLASKIAWLGLASFIMQFTNSLVAMVCNTMLGGYGDVYVSTYTIVSSVRQILDTPVLAIAEGSSPVMSFNYGAKAYGRVKETIRITSFVSISYTLVIWILILLVPEAFIRIFTTDLSIMEYAVPALHIYFFAFIFQALQYSGQTVFKALNMRNQAIFFSLFRKVILVVPLTLLLPHVAGLRSSGVFMAEPISNVVGGMFCFVTMYFMVYRKMLADGDSRSRAA